jgi:hypothetical protein
LYKIVHFDGDPVLYGRFQKIVRPYSHCIYKQIFISLQIQTAIANPKVIAVAAQGKDKGYFVNPDMLAGVPLLLILCGIIYGCILAVGVMLLIQGRKRN